MDDIHARIDALFRENGGRILATLVGAFRDIDLAEDVLQEALIAAIENWPQTGLPPNPIGWLTVTAKRKAIDRLRRQKTYTQKLETLYEPGDQFTENHEMDMENVYPDERLKLMFTTCHPAISQEGQIALTLRTLGGLSTEEIAKAFLVSKQTMAQRLVRTKRKVRDAGIPYRVPALHLLPERLDAVRSVLYLIFNAGYSAGAGEALVRRDLCHEAIRLTEMVLSLLEKEKLAPFIPETQGLLALMLLQDSRRDARVGPGDELVLLDDQDRTKWDQGQINAGLMLLETALAAGLWGPYLIQAAIAAVHARSLQARDTNWGEIVSYYEVLREIYPTPVVELNHAVAVAMVKGPAAGLDLLDRIVEEGMLEGYIPLYAARADFLRRMGRSTEAVEAYRIAIGLSDSPAEVRFFGERIRTLT